MAATYEPIATTTLGTAATTITFSSIPATYTDLRVSFVSTSTAAGDDINLYFNGDNAGTTYSRTSLLGSGAAASSNRETSTAFIRINATSAAASNTIPTFITVDVFSYTAATNKTVLTNWNGDRNGSGYVISTVGLWRNTAAITSLSLFSNTTLATGTTATLYGIKAA